MVSFPDTQRQLSELMPDYLFLWKGKDPYGVVRSEQIAAENAQVAKERLILAGWTDLELVQDEICHSPALEVKAADWVKDHDHEFNTPDQTTEFFEGRFPGFFGQTWTGIKQSSVLILVFSFSIVWGVYTEHRWAWIIGAIGVSVLTLLTPAILLFFGLFSTTLRDYQRLNRAKVWGRWEEVLECVEKLRKPDRITGTLVPEFELVRCRAQALASRGRLEEGLAEFRKFENSPTVEKWMYYSFLSIILDCGQEYEKAHEYKKLAALEKPDNSAVLIDVASSSVRRLNAPRTAREYLAAAEALEITGLGKCHVPFARGMICWREGQLQEAIPYFEESIRRFQSWRHNPLIDASILLSNSYLCAVHGALGNSAEAKRLFRETEKFLAAHHEDELLQACREGLRKAERTPV